MTHCFACLIGEQDGRRFDSAAVRRLGRFARECSTVRIDDVREGAVAFAARERGARTRGCVPGTAHAQAKRAVG
jgi:hypothetical protein